MYNELCGFSAATLNDTAELLFASDATLCRRLEVHVENIVIDSFASMRPLGIVVFEPCLADIVELRTTEAHEMIQAFSLERADEAFAIGVRLGRADWRLYDLHAFRLPELLQSMRNGV